MFESMLFAQALILVGAQAKIKREFPEPYRCAPGVIPSVARNLDLGMGGGEKRQSEQDSSLRSE